MWLWEAPIPVLSIENFIQPYNIGTFCSKNNQKKKKIKNSNLHHLSHRLIALHIFSGCEDSLDKSDLFSRNMSDSEDSDNENSQNTSNKHISRRKIPEQQISPFLDLTYWKK